MTKKVAAPKSTPAKPEVKKLAGEIAQAIAPKTNGAAKAGAFSAAAHAAASATKPTPKPAAKAQPDMKAAPVPGVTMRPVWPPAPTNVKQLPPPKPEKPEPVGELEELGVGAQVIEAAVLCTVKDDPREYLCGVCFRERDGTVEVVATNGHLLLVQRIKVEKIPAWVKGSGTVVHRELLVKLAKLQGEGAVRLQYGKRQPHVLGSTTPSDFARFKLQAIDMQFPDYVKILDGGARAMNGAEVMPLSAPALDPAYVKVAAQVGAILEAEGVYTFLSHEGTPSVFTFGEKHAVALYIMPIGGASKAAFGGEVVKMLAPALRGTVAALRAHITRAKQAEKGANKTEGLVLAAKRSSLEQRLEAILKDGGKALEDKSAKPAAKAAAK